MSSLSKQEKERYARHLALPQFDESVQRQLKAARVLVIGAGGLGCPVLQYLAAAGIGTIGIVDPDRVSTSNLQRQVLYGESDLGQLKVEVAAHKLRDLNPHVELVSYPLALTSENALKIIADYDIIVDGTDNFPTRYLVNDACVLAGKINVYGSVFRFEGQVAVFNAPLANGERSPNYRDLYPVPPPPGQVPNCVEGGVLGVLPGLIGCWQAQQVIQLVTDIGDPLVGKLLIMDLLNGFQRTIAYPVQPATQITALVDYEAFCGMPAREQLPTVDYNTFKQMLITEQPFTLLDVREPTEYARHNLGGINIPLAQLTTTWPTLPTQRPLLVHCQSGQRAAQAVQLLLEEGVEQVYWLPDVWG